MANSLNADGQALADTYPGAAPALSVRSGLPRCIAELLRECTPHGAAAGRVIVASIRPGHACGVPIRFPCPVPVTRSRRPDQNGWDVLDRAVNRTREDWFEAAIGDALPKAKNPTLRPMLRMLLAEPQLRDEGLPAYNALRKNSVPREDLEPHRWASTAQRNGSLVRAVIAAVAYDLEGLELAHDRPIYGPDGQPLDLSVSWLLGLTDHHWYEQGYPLMFKDARRARAFVARGRSFLSAIGFWPWSEVPDGRLRRGWRSDARIVDPLHRWHSRACDEADGRTAAARRALA